MCALFTDLHDVAEVLCQHFRDETGIADVQPGTPRDVATSTEPGARVTLLYVTTQPQHRNDPPTLLADGSTMPPPLAVVCVYLVTTSGAADDDPIGAHYTLGRIMTASHDQPSLTLPLTGGVSLGDGPLDVVQLPMSLDQIDKVWMSLEARLQPWVLFQVSPVHLVSDLPGAAAAPVVRPGGVGLDVRPGPRPSISRVTPQMVRPGGRIRVEMDGAGGPVQVRISAMAVAPGSVTDHGAGVLLITLDGALATSGPGSAPVTVQVAGLESRPAPLRIADPAAAVVDAPAPHDPAHDLVLAGANLVGASHAVLWPDEGVSIPAQVQSLALTAVSAGSVTLAAAQLATLSSVPSSWRLAIETDPQQFTPYVVLDLLS